MVEKYWGGWKAGSRRAGGHPDGTGTEGAALRPRAVAERHAAVRHGGIPVARRSTRRARTRRRCDILAALFFGPTSELYKKLVVAEQKVDALEVDVPASVDPSLFTVLARVKKPADAVYVRDQILATVAAARTVAGAGAAPRRRQVVRPVCLCPDARQHRAHRGGDFAVSPRTGAPYDTVNAYYRTLDSAHARRRAGEPRASISPTRADRDDARRRIRCRPASSRRPRSTSIAPAVAVTSRRASCRVAPPSLPSRPAGAATCA